MSVSRGILCTTPLFQDLRDDVLATLGTHVQAVTYVPNQMVYRIGERGGALLVAISGTIKISSTDALGKPLVMGIVYAGDVLGELSLSADEP